MSKVLRYKFSKFVTRIKKIAMALPFYNISTLANFESDINLKLVKIKVAEF